MASQEQDTSVDDEEYFQPISAALIYQWRKIRAKYPKNAEEEEKAKIKKAEELARRKQREASRQNRRRGREPTKPADATEEDQEDERPNKRRKITHDNEDNEIERNNSNDEATENALPLEVVSMVFDQLDLIDIYRYCILVCKAWRSLAPTKITKAFEQLNEEIKQHTKKYPKYMKCTDYLTRIKNLMPQYNDILPLVYHRIKRTLAAKKDKRELFTISVEDAQEFVDVKDRHLFIGEGTGYVFGDEPDEEIIPIGCSKVGGVPDLPPSIEWPSENGRAELFYAQLRLDELSLFDICGLLPWTTGMLYIFSDQKVIHYDGVLASRDPTGLIDIYDRPLKPESCAEMFFDLSLMKPDEETWNRGVYYDATSDIKKKNCLHVLGFSEFEEEMPGFESEEEEAAEQDEEEDDGYKPEVPSTMLFGTISASVFDTLHSRTYAWTISYDDLAAKKMDSVHFEIGGD